MSKKTVEKIVKEILAERGWDVIYKLYITEEEDSNYIDASIGVDYWDIRINTDPSLEKILNQVVQKEKLNISFPLKKLLYTVSTHEEGHWSICPFDGVDYGEEILEGVTKGLKKGGLDKEGEELEAYAFRGGNMFGDIITNVTLAFRDPKRKEWREGRGLKYLLSALTNKKGLFGGGPSYSKCFALFVDCQMKLYQENPYFRNLANKFCKEYEEIKGLSKRVIEVLVEDHIAKKAFLNKKIEDEDEEYIQKKVNDREKWVEKAEKFGEIIAPYIEEMTEKIPDNPFMQQMKKKGNFRTQVIQRGIEKKHSMNYANPIEVMVELYKRISEEIVVKFLKEEAEAHKHDLFYMTKEKIEEGNQLENIAWEKTMFVDTKNGEELWLFKNRNPFRIEEPQQQAVGSVEDILFIVDTSESMDWTRPLDGSKYDLTVRAINGAIKYLERAGKAPYLRYGLMQFGTKGQTTFTGWIDYYDIQTLLERIFTGYQNAGETKLDADKIEEALAQNGDNFISIMTTDGKLHNAEEALPACQNVIMQGNDFVILQMKSRSQFAQAMECYGAEVKNVDKPEDLIGLTLTKIKQKYTPKKISKVS